MMTFLLSLPDASPIKRPIDDALIRRIAAGDMEALHDLYDSVHGNIYGFALSIVRNPHDADDVLQETFLKVYAKAGEYKPQGKPLAWVFTIARNLALDRVRQTARTQPLPDAPPDTAGFFPAEADERVLLYALLSRMPEAEKQILILHAVRGMKHREIAAVLDMRLNTVLSKYHRAIKQLKEALKEETPL